MGATILENIKKTTKSFIEALNTMDIDALEAGRTDDFIFQTLPHSLERPVMGNQEFRGMWLNFMKPTFANFKVEPITVVHDAEARRATVYADVSADMAIGSRKWQLIQMLKFNDDGSKMERLDEFFDSKTYVEMVAALDAASVKTPHQEH